MKSPQQIFEERKKRIITDTKKLSQPLSMFGTKTMRIMKSMR